MDGQLAAFDDQMDGQLAAGQLLASSKACGSLKVRRSQGRRDSLLAHINSSSYLTICEIKRSTGAHQLHHDWDQCPLLLLPCSYHLGLLPLLEHGVGLAGPGACSGTATMTWSRRRSAVPGAGAGAGEALGGWR